jgi:restriction system protein
MKKIIKFPDHFELIIPTIKALKIMGGSATTDEITNKVIEIEKYDDEIINAPQKGDKSRTQLEYRLAWARTYLKKFLNGIEDTSRGLWSLTEVGQKLDISDSKRIISDVKKNKNVNSKIYFEKNGNKINLDAIVEDVDAWKDKLLNIIIDCSPKSFELLTKKMLRESGCINVEVTGKPGDKGIDGTAILRLGLISFPIKFQCKRYQKTNFIGPSDIREFRGSFANIDKGIFITTTRFTKAAIEEAADSAKGKTIDLIDGNRFCDLLRQYKVGISEEIVIDKEFFENL